MNIAAIIRIAAGVAVVALFIADYGLAAMAKEIPPWIYYLLLAIVFGVDVEWLRKAMQQGLARWIGAIPRDGGENP